MQQELYYLHNNRQVHCADKYSQHSSIIWLLCLNGWVSLLDKVPRVPKCPSAQVLFECPSVQVPERPSAQVSWVSEYPSALGVPKCLKYPSALSARVPKCPSSARVPECLECLEYLECLECLKCLSALESSSASVSQLVFQSVISWFTILFQ